jgi:hypothetical protein
MTQGTLTVDGRPAAGEQIVLFAPGEPPLLDVATSGDGGRFAFDVAELPAGARLLAKARGEAIGFALAEPDGGPLAIDVPGPFHPVRIGLSGADAPEELTLWLDPEGLPRDTARLVRVGGPRVREAHYLRRPLPAAGVELRLAPGAWRLGAEALWPDRVPGFGDNPDRAAVRATAGGRALDGDREDGFLLDVGGPLDVTLELAEV